MSHTFLKRTNLWTSHCHFIICSRLEVYTETPACKIQATNKYGSDISQAIATAITFSFSYKAHYCCQKTTLFPTVQVSKRGFEIFLYDSDTDVLLMNMFVWSRTTIFFLWAVLHYRLLLTKTTLLSENLKCGYRELSDKYGGLTSLEGHPGFAVPLTSISASQLELNEDEVYFRCGLGQKRKHRK